MDLSLRPFLVAMTSGALLGLTACGRQASQSSAESSANNIVAQATSDNDQANNGTINKYKETILLKQIPTNSVRLPPNSLERSDR
jgi:hypothetical protein